VDVTPYPDAKRAPLSLNPGYSPIIVDMSAVPNGNVSLPLRFIPLDEHHSDLIAYATELNTQEAEHYSAALAASRSISGAGNRRVNAQVQKICRASPLSA
jgi:hypothetical protein